MKQLKTLIAATGLLGIIATFLPYISVEGLSMKYWDFRALPSSMMSGALNGPKQVYIALACFAVPLLLGLIAVATKRLARWQAIVSAVFFLFAFGPEGVRKGLSGAEGVGTAIGGKLLFLSAAVGLVVSLIGSIKPDRK